LLTGWKDRTLGHRKGAAPAKARKSFLKAKAALILRRLRLRHR
jgi:hypothetical protein